MVVKTLFLNWIKEFSSSLIHLSTSLSHIDYVTDKKTGIFWITNMSNDEILDVPGTAFTTVPGSQH